MFAAIGGTLMKTTAEITPDLLADSFFEHPFSTYAWLREHDPVHWSGQLQAWVVTRHDDVVAILRDPKRFSNAGRQLETLEHLPQSAQASLCPMKEEYKKAGIINADPPEHTRMRQLLNKAFSASHVEQLRPRVHELTDELIDQHLPNGRMDIYTDLSRPLPMYVFCEMMGVPVSDRHLFVPWTQAVTKFVVTPQLTVEIALEAQEAIAQFKRYFRSLLAQRKKDRKEDVLTALADAEEMGDRFTEQEIISTARNLMLAGQNTTTYLITNCVYMLLTHPRQMKMVLDDPNLTVAAVEETLRFNGSVHSMKRLATQDVEMRGKIIRKGQAVIISVAAANHDPAQFERPDEFDITRPTDQRHIAFGFGIHFCIGMPLARMEGPIVLDAVLRRMKGLKLAANEPPRWLPNIIERGLTSLPVMFTPSSA
jgi:cytochrome P450